MRRPTRAEITTLLTQALDKALEVQAPAVRRHLDSIRQAGDRTPQQILDRLEKQYLTSVTAIGGASGMAAAAPGAGTAIAIPVNLAEIGGFLELTTLFVLTVAELHDLHPDDIERRRTLVLAVLLGDAGSGIIDQVAGRTGPHWARQIVNTIPASSIKAVNKILGHNFVTKQGTKQGILVLGRELPLGIGALIGAGGNYGLGYLTIKAARNAFGPPPEPAT